MYRREVECLEIVEGQKDECIPMLGYVVDISMEQKFYIHPMLFSMPVERYHEGLQIRKPFSGDYVSCILWIWWCMAVDVGSGNQTRQFQGRDALILLSSFFVPRVSRMSLEDRHWTWLSGLISGPLGCRIVYPATSISRNFFNVSSCLHATNRHAAATSYYQSHWWGDSQ